MSTVPATVVAVAVSVKLRVAPAGMPPAGSVIVQVSNAPAALGSVPQFTALTLVPRVTAVAITPAGS